MSIFAKIAEDPGMKAQLRAAKEKPMEARKRPKDFDGPDGNYVAKFMGQRTNEKDGNTLCFFEFVIVGGDYDGSRTSRLFWFSGTEPSDLTMENLVNTCRVMGCDTDKDIDPQLDKIVRAGTLYDVGIVTKPDKKDPEKKHTTVYVNRVHDAVVPPVKDDKVGMDLGEWGEVTESPTTKEGYDGPSLANDTVVCQDEKCICLSHDLETNLLVLANPDDHDEVWYEAVHVSEVKV